MKLRNKRFRDYKTLADRYRFRVFFCRYNRENRSVTRPLIVLMDKELQIPVKVTTLGDIMLYRRDISEFTADRRDLSVICQFLNYVFFEHADRYRVTDLADITLNMVQDFMTDYGNTRMKDGRYPARSTLIAHRNAVCQFAARLCHVLTMRHLKESDIMRVHNTRQAGGRTVKSYEYGVNLVFHEDLKELKHLHRDMPNELIPKLLDRARTDDPEIVFAIVLGYRAGLREGEICSLRDEGSCFGSSFTFQKEMGTCTGITIDLMKEYDLRPADHVIIGGIKRERRQAVYPVYAPEIYEAYMAHRELMKTRPRQKTMPMFTNKNRTRSTGVYEAMTVKSYTTRVTNLMKSLLPQLAADPEPALQRFYLEMLGRSWGVHAFRHLFTVNLVVREDLDLAMIKLLRGDRSDTAAASYLNNKGVFRRKYDRTVAEMHRDILSGIPEEEPIGLIPEEPDWEVTP